MALMLYLPVFGVDPNRFAGRRGFQVLLLTHLSTLIMILYEMNITFLKKASGTQIVWN